MHILLIYPIFPRTFWSFTYALPFIRKKAAHPPLGLLTVGSLLPDQWQKKLVDLNVHSLTEADLEWADMVFISGMVVQKKSVRETIEKCKEYNLPVVAGGPLFISETEDFMDVDHLVLDEAEITLPRFLEDLERGTAKHIYRTASFADIRQTPVPQWDLLDMKKYASMSIQFSRGCPFNCEFCNVTALFGHKPRMKTPEQIIAELESIYNAGWRNNIFFVDDNFIGNKGYLKRTLLPALIEWRKEKKGLVFYTEASINLADDPELMNLMVQAGFDSVFIGIESPDESSLGECHKNQNLKRDLLEDVKKIQRSGLQVLAGFIVGFDSDGPSTFQRMIDFIQKSGIVTAMVGVLQAPPGTPLFERMKKENRLTDMLSGDNVDGTTNIIPKMGLETLQDGYRSIMSHIYSPRNYYKRIRTFLKEFKVPEISAPSDFGRIMALVRSSIRLGIWGKERCQYWYLVFWTLIRRPRQFPVAITLAIYGYHFRRICQLHILDKRKAC